MRSPKAVALLALAAIATLLVVFRPADDPERRGRPPLRVEVVAVTVQNLFPTRVVSGRLQAAQRADLEFEVSGRVVARHVEPGQQVAIGEQLLSLDDGDRRDALQQAQADLDLETAGIARDRELLALSRRSAKLARGEVERLERLGREALSSKSQMDQARRTALQLESEAARLATSVATAEARVAQRRALRDQARRNLERTRLTAPFAGTVNNVHPQVGDMAGPGQTAVQLVDTGELDLYAQVRGGVAAALERGQRVPVHTDQGAMEGHVFALQTDPDPDTFTHALRVRLPGDRARAGAAAWAELSLAPLRQVLTVPVTAVLRDEGRDYLFRVTDGQLERLPVTLGPRVDDRQTVLDGIEAGDQVVARGVAALSHGQAVESLPLGSDG